MSYPGIIIDNAGDEIKGYIFCSEMVSVTFSVFHFCVFHEDKSAS